MAGLFGGGSGMDDILASPSSDVFLKKATITLAAVFFLTSLVLAVRTSRETAKSLMERTVAPSAPISVPAQQPGGTADMENTGETPDME